MKKSIVLLFFICTVHLLNGQSIKSITLKDAGTGSEVAMSSFTSKKAVVVVFFSNICPYAEYYESRITTLIKDFESKDVGFVLINSHTEAEESLEAMRRKLNEWNISVPYLKDADQTAMRIFDAHKSPQAFLLKPSQGSFSVYYKGAIDNNPQVASDVKYYYLRDNINNLLKGLPAAAGQRPIGCMIKESN